jgi:nitroimidazol reductase NimA-like FMN-containing flavoprotein (pyridoxamine 5'-phosphate oxidase superfamily)
MTSDREPDSQAALEPMDAAACGRLLAAVQVGRVAVVVESRPVIVVMNYAVDGPDLLMRTVEDALLSRLTADGHVVHAAFEVDNTLEVGRSGWSVIATGLLKQEQDPVKVEAALARVRPWAAGKREVVLRLQIQDLSGRHVGPLSGG